MTSYIVRFTTSISLVVDVEAGDEEAAADLGWERAEEYLKTVYGAGDVRAEASLDGIGADEVEEP